MEKRWSSWELLLHALGWISSWQRLLMCQGAWKLKIFPTKNSKKKSSQRSLYHWWIFFLPQFNWGFFSQASPFPPETKKSTVVFCGGAALRSLLMVERVGQGGLVEAGGLQIPSHPIHREFAKRAFVAGWQEWNSRTEAPYQVGSVTDMVVFSDPAFF